MRTCFLIAVLFFSQAGCLYSQDSSSLSLENYFSFEQNGMYTTGSVLADLNNDDFLDIVQANGNDMAPQPLTIYYNTGRSFGTSYNSRVDHYFSDIDYHTNLAVGDIDNDGFVDIVAVSPFNNFNKKCEGGKIKVYINNNGRFLESPSMVKNLNYSVFDVDLGDIDGDGDLDLAVACVGKCESNTNELISMPSFVFENKMGKIDFEKPFWSTYENYSAWSLNFADFNRDGKLDLALGHVADSLQAGAISIFFGNEHFLDIEPRWNGGVYDDVMGFSLTSGLLIEEKENAYPAILTTLMSTSNTNRESSGFYLYQTYDSSPVWKLNSKEMKYVDNPSYSAISDLNNDGISDLVLGYYSLRNCLNTSGAPLLVYSYDSLNESYLKSSPDSITQMKLGVNEQIAIGDINNECLVYQEAKRVLVNGEKVVTLNHNNVQVIDSVMINGEIVSHNNYNWCPNEFWLSLSNEIFINKKGMVYVSVFYKISRKKKLLRALWNPNFGSLIYSVSD
ncbi:FG-GAP and VCBS repeat-containing protein [Aureibacter tunicatorum]|uniref:VCBS repeat-containing protein n=1 Tax=Aureibacter tunicatorum TaxID=866807 RepID=A0AAE4BP73_9BACT|nr:FG-GAP and VCBS repeat-containing protein [Aureibacter tunicatorum]MDR6237654.1 hypothetical protein [Aureibacter tunicatorum]BDD02689.1 hypothetical protein AUTU_01720 [Aureibacter tunicatorum]